MLQASNILTPLLSFLREFKQHFSAAIKKEDKIHLYALFIILAIAIAIRLFFLFLPMRYDEAYTYLNYVSKPLSVGLSWYKDPNNHLFHTLLAHITYLMFGNKPWVIRLPALFAGILLVPASYLFTRILFNKYAALLTAGFVASSSILIDYSINARGYTLVCLIFLLIFALGAHLGQNRSRTGWFLLALLSALGFYTIPIMLYPFGVVVIWLFLSSTLKDTGYSSRDLIIYLILAGVLTFILYVPVLLTTGLESIINNQFVVSLPWSDFITKLPSSLKSLWNQWNRDVPDAVRFLLGVGFFVSLVFHRRLTNYRIPIILPVIGWIIPILMIQRVVPYNRVWLFLLPLYIASASAGVSYLLSLPDARISRYKPVIFAVLAITLSSWLGLSVVNSRSVCYSDEGGTLRDAEDITLFLKGCLKPGDRVLAACPSNFPLIYYFGLHNVSWRYFKKGYFNRLLVIVNDSHNQTLKGVLDEEGMRGMSFSNKLIKRYESATLYEVKKIRGQP